MPDNKFTSYTFCIFDLNNLNEDIHTNGRKRDKAKTFYIDLP